MYLPRSSFLYKQKKEVLKALNTYSFERLRHRAEFDTTRYQKTS